MVAKSAPPSSNAAGGQISARIAEFFDAQNALSESLVGFVDEKASQAAMLGYQRAATGLIAVQSARIQELEQALADSRVTQAEMRGLINLGEYKASAPKRRLGYSTEDVEAKRAELEAERGGPVTHNMLAEALGISRSRVSQILGGQ